jgi:hypothetical protein
MCLTQKLTPEWARSMFQALVDSEVLMRFASVELNLELSHDAD